MNRINDIKRWTFSLIAAVILGTGILYIFSNLFFKTIADDAPAHKSNIKPSPYPSSVKADNSLSQITVRAYENAKQAKNANITPPTLTPYIIKPKYPHSTYVRIPPIMPAEAQKSGHCKIRFDVDKKGKPYNIEALSCTDNIFQEPTLAAVTKWRLPKKGEARRKGIEHTVRYILHDASGQIIPE